MKSDKRIGQYYSWEIVDVNNAIKTCDTSFFEYNATGVPRDICWFFCVDKIKKGDSANIELIYQGKKYDAILMYEKPPHGRVRMRWNKDLGQNLQSFKNFSFVKATFSRITDGVYELSMSSESEYDGIDFTELTLEELDKYVEENNLIVSPRKKDGRPQESGKLSDNATVEILKEYGRLSEKKNAPLFAKVSWKGLVRYDVRTWDTSKTIPYKGIAFTEEELSQIVRVGDLKQIGKTQRAEFNGGKGHATIYENVCYLDEQAKRKGSWSKEINIVDWGYGIKYDMRRWSANYQKCRRGITLSPDEYLTFLSYANQVIDGII